MTLNVNLGCAFEYEHTLEVQTAIRSESGTMVNGRVHFKGLEMGHFKEAPPSISQNQVELNLKIPKRRILR